MFKLLKNKIEIIKEVKIMINNIIAGNSTYDNQVVIFQLNKKNVEKTITKLGKYSRLSSKISNLSGIVNWYGKVLSGALDNEKIRFSMMLQGESEEKFIKVSASMMNELIEKFDGSYPDLYFTEPK